MFRSDEKKGPQAITMHYVLNPFQIFHQITLLTTSGSTTGGTATRRRHSVTTAAIDAATAARASHLRCRRSVLLLHLIKQLQLRPNVALANVVQPVMRLLLLMVELRGDASRRLSPVQIQAEGFVLGSLAKFCCRRVLAVSVGGSPGRIDGPCCAASVQMVVLVRMVGA